MKVGKSQRFRRRIGVCFTNRIKKKVKKQENNLIAFMVAFSKSARSGNLYEAASSENIREGIHMKQARLCTS